MTNEPQKRSWKQTLKHEFVEYLFNFAFLAFFLVAFAWYRRLVLAGYGIAFTSYWAPLIEAAILAKVIMIGDILRMARRFRDRPLVVPTIYRTLIFSIFVVLFSFAEHALRARFHGKPMLEGITEITSQGPHELLAWYVLLIVTLLPFFAVKEIERIYGVETIRRLFFRRYRGEANSSEQNNPPSTKGVSL
jgi:hypothetical protein